MGKSMKEVIHENHIKANREYTERIRKYKKQQEKKNTIIFCILTVILATLVITGIIIQKRDLDRCKAVYSTEYCELGL